MKNRLQKAAVMTLFLIGLVAIFFPLFSGDANLRSDRILAVPATELPLTSSPLAIENQDACKCECDNHSVK